MEPSAQPARLRHFGLHRGRRWVFRLAAISGFVAFSLFGLSQPAVAQEAFNTANVIKLSEWLMYIALATCIGGIFVSTALWAIGSKGQNPGQELTGKKGIVLCLTAAFFIGILPHLIGFFENLASQEGSKTGVYMGGTCTQEDVHAGRC